MTQSESRPAGTLHIVATPIGNLGDIACAVRVFLNLTCSPPRDPYGLLAA